MRTSVSNHVVAVETVKSYNMVEVVGPDTER